MKDYLTKDERIDLLKVIVTGHSIEQLLENWKNNLSIEERKYWKMAKAFNEKAYNLVLGRLKPGQHKLIVDAADDYERNIRDDYVIDKQHMDILIEGALLSCCSPCHCNHDKKCPWREFFKTYNVPFANESKNKKGACPWEQVDSKNVFSLPCKIGDRVRYLDNGEWRESYIDCISYDKRGWLMHPAAADFWLDMRDEGAEWELK